MQRTIECHVCFNSFDTKGRIPKTLPCGHGYCQPCLEKMLKDSSITCPTCRSPCVIPHGKVDQLPTSYATLDVLDAVCHECQNQPYTLRCDHCSQNLCDSCHKSHPQTSKPTGADAGHESYSQKSKPAGLESLLVFKEAIVQRQDDVANDSIIDDIKSQGEHVIMSINGTYKSQMDDLQRQHEASVGQMKRQISQDIDSYFAWKERYTTCLEDALQFIDASVTLTKDPNISSEQPRHLEKLCTQRSAELDYLMKVKPCVTEITFAPPIGQFDNLIAAWKNSITDGTSSCITQPTASRSSRLVPDYSKANFSHMYNGCGDTLAPFGIAASVTGDIAITEMKKQRIHILNKDMGLETSFGGTGSSEGEFSNASGVAVSRDDKVFIADMCNHRIQVTGIGGRYLYSFGSFGRDLGLFNKPCGLAMDTGGLIYVCDAYNYRIQVMKMDGSVVRTFGSRGSGAGQFLSRPCFIAVSSHHHKLAISDSHGNLYLFSPTGHHIKSILANTAPQNIYAYGVAIDDHENIIIANSGSSQGPCIVVLRKDCEMLTSIGKTVLEGPRGLALNQQGNIVVCDWGKSCVQMFSVPKMKGRR